MCRLSWPPKLTPKSLHRSQSISQGFPSEHVWIIDWNLFPRPVILSQCNLQPCNPQVNYAEQVSSGHEEYYIQACNISVIQQGLQIYNIRQVMAWAALEIYWFGPKALLLNQSFFITKPLYVPVLAFVCLVLASRQWLINSVWILIWRWKKSLTGWAFRPAQKN